MPGLNNAADQAKQFWASRNGRQRAFLLGGAAASVIVVMLFVRLIGGSDYKPLFTGMEPADAQAMSAKLDEQGIPHRTGTDGKSLLVPADKLDVARMQTAEQGGPHSGRMGFELFDKMSWGQTEFDEKVTYQRALEGELEKSIETLADVESARVHLVMPTDSVYADRDRGAKASVILRLRHGTLSKDAALAISRLVSGAVDELRAEDVSIIDADSARSLGIGQGGADEGAGSGTDLSSRLMSTLEPVVGTGKIRASVNVDYDQGSTDESQEKYDPTVSALLSDQKSEDHAGGAPVPAGVPGTTSNIPTNDKQQKQPAPAAAAQSSTTESAQYGVNRTVTHTVTPAGRIQRITAAILVDDELVKNVQKGKTTFTRKKRSPQELAQIKELAEAVIGFDAKRGDSISVENLSFDADAAEMDIPAPAWTTQVQKTVTDYSSLLRPVSLLVLFILVYMFVLRPVQKHAFSATTLPAGSDHLLPAPHGGAMPAARPELGSGAVRAAQLKEETAEMIKQKPVHTARAVQAWLREEPS
ncbi:MAG: flagellar basal-body MS-ring/collar protein FliF [Terracidiphilus sp.]